MGCVASRSDGHDLGHRGGLRLWDGHNLQALEQCSPLVNSLATPAATAWLIHPSEITDELRKAHANTR